MPLSEYARSEYEEDSEFVMSDEEDDTGPQNPPDIESHHDPPESPPIDKPRLEVLEDSLSNTSQNSPNRNGTQMESAPSSIISNDASKFINHVDLVMNKIKTLQSDNRWNRVLKHRTGVQVYAQKHAKTIGKAKTVPVFKGVGLIKGYSPASVFAVIGSSKLWDEWYADGNLVENLSDQVSLTYMRMKAGIGTRTRDLSLVEKVEATADGSIYFCASSVDTPRVPIVPGKIRAHIELNGWVLEPIKLPESAPGASTTATKVTYYLQVNVKTFVAEAVSKRYLARRPLCITKIDAYLQKYGSPVQLEGISDTEAHPRQGGNRRTYSRNFMSLKQIEFPKDPVNGNNGGAAVPNSSGSLSSRGMRAHLPSIGPFGQKIRTRLPSSASVPTLNRNDPNISKPSQSIHAENRPTAGSAPAKAPQPLLIGHLKPNKEIPNWNSISQAFELFNAYLSDFDVNRKDWKAIENSSNSVRMWLNFPTSQMAQKSRKKQEGLFQLPVIKSETILDTLQNTQRSHPITPEQISMTILSNLAQQTWDQHFHGYSKLGTQHHQHQLLLNTDNGFDQATYLGTMRAVYPHIRDESMFCFDQVVFRQSTASADESLRSKIVIIHHSVEDEDGYLKRLETDKDQLADCPGVKLFLREKIEQKVLSKIDVAGWLIESVPSSDQIKVTHLSALSLNLKNQRHPPTNQTNSLPDFLQKLIASNIASRPHQVSELIRECGFFPGFVRWMDGEIQYGGDHLLDHSEQTSTAIKGGQIEWRFKRKPQESIPQSTLPVPSIKTSASVHQICWFQWSEQMYPYGIDLTLEPADVAEVRLVSEPKNTLQFDWKADAASLKSSQTADGAKTIKLKAKRIHSIDSSTPQRVNLNGSRLLATVQVKLDRLKTESEKIAEGRDSLKNDSTVGKANKASKDDDQAKSNHESNPIHDPSSASNPPSNLAPALVPSPSDLLTDSDKNKKSYNPNPQRQLTVDHNVAIIITQNIYFTRSQVFFFFLCLGLAYLYARFG